MASWLNGKMSINCQDVNVIRYRLHVEFPSKHTIILLHSTNIYHLHISMSWQFRQIITFKY
jgi:hypothetical protein